MLVRQSQIPMVSGDVLRPMEKTLVSPTRLLSRKLFPEWYGPTTEMMEMLSSCCARLTRPSITGIIDEWFAVGRTTWMGLLISTPPMADAAQSRVANARTHGHRISLLRARGLRPVSYYTAEFRAQDFRVSI